MLSTDPGHQVLERRINNVRLKGPEDFIAAQTSGLCPAGHGRQQSRKAGIGNDNEMVFELSDLRLRQEHRSYHQLGTNTGDQLVELIGPVDKKESVPFAAREIADAGLFPGQPLARQGQALNHQRVEAVFQHNVFKVTMQLDNGRIGTLNGGELTRMLRQKYVVE